MEVYLAGGESTFKKYLRESIVESGLLKHANILRSYYYMDSFIEEQIIPNCRNYMTDSGAFTFFKQDTSRVDWGQWLKEYADYIIRNGIDLFFELDIDTIVGYQKVKEYRRMLERAVGKPCIPVWHKNRGKEEFIRMCKEYDYVALGGLTEKGKSRNKYFPWFIDTAHKHGAKIHALGFTSMKELPLYHFDSVDSSSWTYGNRYGRVHHFDGRTLIMLHRPENQRISNHKDLAVYNFNEWVKFQRYARRHL